MRHTAKVCIIGRNTLLNELIGFTAQSELGEQYEIVSHVDEVDFQEDDESLLHLLLADDSDSGCRAGLFRILADKQHPARSRIVGAFFNVDMEESNLAEAVRHGIKGLFFSSDPIERVMKGIRVLLDGDVWVSREILIHAVTTRDVDSGVVIEQSRLTMREMEVLSLVSTGATNDQIAATLFISPHTVKTHVYNIFQKIGVESRLHAAMWATRHLRGRLPAFISTPAAVEA